MSLICHKYQVKSMYAESFPLSVKFCTIVISSVISRQAVFPRTLDSHFF